MGENGKMQSLSNDLIRRLLNTSETLGMAAKLEVVDNYTQKLFNSGYQISQARRIVLNGIKGYERRVKESRTEGGRKLHRTAEESSKKRTSKKLLGKSDWFRKPRKSTEATTLKQSQERGAGQNNVQSESCAKPKTAIPKIRTVLFVDQTKDGKQQQRYLPDVPIGGYKD